MLVATSAIWELRDGRIDRFALPPGTPRTQPLNLFRDRDGALWIGSRDGLIHLHEGRVDTFQYVDGLSGNDVVEAFEDREGSVWVITGGGLDRFRPFAVTTHYWAPGATFGTVLADRDGNTWLASHEGLFRVRDGHVSVYRGAHGDRIAAGIDEVIVAGLPDMTIAALLRDSRGRLWVGSLAGFGYLVGSRFVSVAGVPPG